MENASLALDDLGFLQGVTLVERLRTCRGVALDAAAHLTRLDRGCQALGIPLPAQWRLSRIVGECIERNRANFDPGDFSMVVLVTPGRRNHTSPTLIVHPAEIAWHTLHRWYQEGQALVVPDARNVPEACWSPHLKTRSRLHYYLGDRQAEVEGGNSAGGVLLDLAGNLTETSMANVILVEGRQLTCPPTDSILPGISLERTLRLAGQAGWRIAREPISVERAVAAQELLLSGSTGCLWPARRLTCSQPLHQRDYPAAQGRAFIELSRCWSDDIGLDYIAQAKHLSGSQESPTH